MDFGILLLILFILAPLLEKLLQAGRPKQPPGQQPRQPGRPGRPGQGMPPPQQRRPTQAQRPTPGPEAREDEAAAGMLPDDLWEILTGERRPPVQQAPPERDPWEPMPSRDVPEEAHDREFTYDAPTPAPAPPPRPREPVQSRAPRPLPDRSRTTARERRLPEVEKRRLPEVEKRRLPPTELRRPGHVVRKRSAGPPATAADDYLREIPVREAPVVVSMEDPIEDAETRRARFHERLARTARTERAEVENPWAIASGDDLRRAIVMAEILGPPKGLR